MRRILSDILPRRIYEIINKIEIENGFLEEIRIRRNRQAYAVSSGRNILLNVIANDEEMQAILLKISHNSLYAYKDTIANGYITLDKGVRIGLVGRASIENGNVVGIYNISEFSIRLPNKIKVKCGDISELIGSSSALIYSPPGEGKTTLLRAIIKELSKGTEARRIGVIDTRDELCFDLDEKSLLITLLSGYPRKLGIEIAVRTMNSQIIVCDEIGDERDAAAIIDAQGAGVPLIASCHASSIEDMFSHTGIAKLHQAKIFNYYIGIKRGNDFNFVYTVTSWEEANAYI